MFWIFISLGIVNIICLLAVAAAGFWTRFGLANQTHIAGAIITSVYTLLVHSLVFVYFMGSSKSLNEGVLRNGLDANLLTPIPGLRRKAFMRAWFVSSTTVAAAIVGGGVWSGYVPKWVHMSLGILDTVLVIYFFPTLCKCIRENSAIVQKVQQLIAQRAPSEPEQQVEEYQGLIPLGKGLVITGFSIWALFAYMRWIMHEEVHPFPWFFLFSGAAIGLGFYLMKRENLESGGEG